MIRNAQFNWERSLIKMTLNLLVTFYFAMLVVLQMKVYKTNLVTCHLIPVVMTSFNTAASLLLEPLINMHLTICHTLFKTNCHINFTWIGAGWKTFLNIHLLLGGKPQGSCTTSSPLCYFSTDSVIGACFRFLLCAGQPWGIGTTGSCQ